MNAKQDFIVGGLFLIGLALIGIFTIVVKDITLFQGRAASMSLVFDSVDGLEIGHKVLASGMEVGSVSGLELKDNGDVKVDVNLVKPIKLYEGYEVKVKDASALGGKYVDIEIGDDTKPVEVTYGYDDVDDSRKPTEQPLPGRAQESILSDPNVSALVESLKKIAQSIERGEGTAGLIIKEREIYDNLKATSENLKQITDQMRNSQSTIGKLLYDGELYDRINRIAANIEDITGQVRSGEGTLGKLIYDNSTHDNLKETLANANKVMSNVKELTDRVMRGEGTVGKLFTDEKLYNELEHTIVDARTMISGINETLASLNQGKGTLGTLLKDETMAKNLAETMENIKVVTARLQKGEGTIGKLMADDELYKEIRRLVKNFSDSLEDTREQVPITTFTNILFKAF